MITKHHHTPGECQLEPKQIILNSSVEVTSHFNLSSRVNYRINATYAPMSQNNFYAISLPSTRSNNL